MISQVIITIEHGDTTDPLDEFLDAAGCSENYSNPMVLDYSVKVDICTADTLIEDNGDRLCGENLCQMHECTAYLCNC